MSKHKQTTNLNLYSHDENLYSVLTESERKFEHIFDLFKVEIEAFQVNQVSPHYIGALLLIDNSLTINKVAEVLIKNRTFTITVQDKRHTKPIIKTIEQMRGLEAFLDTEKNVLKVVVPDPTEEMREKVIKEMKENTELFKDQVQNIMRDSLAELEKKKKTKVLNEDSFKVGKKVLDNLKDNALRDLDALSSKQEKDVRRGIK